VVRLAHVGGRFGDWGESNGIGSAAFHPPISDGSTSLLVVSSLTR
jgi:hypothetical protein